MRLTGEGAWGEPRDRGASILVLSRLRALEVNLVDTADAYGPDVCEPVIREAQQVEMSRRRLGVDSIALWQLHRIDPKVPREEQFDAMKQFQDEGLVGYLGLSGVTVEDVEVARRHFPVATVQNR